MIEELRKLFMTRAEIEAEKKLRERLQRAAEQNECAVVELVQESCELYDVAARHGKTLRASIVELQKRRVG